MTNEDRRALFTQNDKDILSIFFDQNPYPDPKEKMDLSTQVDKPLGKISNWFKNQRARKSIKNPKRRWWKKMMNTLTNVKTEEIGRPEHEDCSLECSMRQSVLPRTAGKPKPSDCTPNHFKESSSGRVTILRQNITSTPLFGNKAGSSLSMSLLNLVNTPLNQTNDILDAQIEQKTVMTERIEPTDGIRRLHRRRRRLHTTAKTLNFKY